MTIEEAIDVLERHNKWRKGATIPMEKPIELGMAIDLIVCEIRELRKKQSQKDTCNCVENIVENYIYDENYNRICSECGKFK